VKVKSLHSWQVSTTQAIAIQKKLAAQVSKKSKFTTPHYIAGVDISTISAHQMATAAVVVLQYPELRVVEEKVVQGKLDFPYIPGLLSFREAPLTLAACQELSITPDLFLIDGQGIAHPRRIGLASHLGLFLNTPTIGCAKSLLCGHHEILGAEPGSYAEIIDRDEIIGAVVRTKLRVKPIYVSTGHNIDLPGAIHWALECCRGYRLPEPTRLAHIAAKGNLKSQRPAITVV